MNPRAFYRQRPLVALAASYAPGILLGRMQDGLSVLLPAAGIAASLAATALFTRKSATRFFSCCLAFLFLGMLLGGLAAHPRLPGEGKYAVEATVRGQSVFSEDGRQIKAQLENLRLTDASGAISRLHAAYWTYYPEEGAALPLQGQQVRFSGSLYHPQGQVNPHGFDFRDYLLQKGIPAGISGASELILVPGALVQPQSPWPRARLLMGRQLDKALGEHAELAKALLLGVREGLDEDLNRSFRLAGIAHVLAVSGLHVGFLALGLRKLLSVFHLSPRVTLLLFAVFLGAYCRLLDFTPSVVRAGILTLLFIGGKALKRRVDPLTSLAAAFLLILLARPLDLFNLGFQLSFLAVLGIFILADRLNSLLDARPWFKSLPALFQKAIQAYVITLSASALTVIPLINAFHQVSLVGFLINPLAVALIGVLLAGFILVLLVSWVSLPLASLLAVPVGGLAGAYESAITFFAGLPWAPPRVGAVSMWAFAAFCLLLFSLTRYCAIRKKYRTALQAALAMFLLGLALVPGSGELRYIQLSTGFSDSAVILDRDSTLVIDTAEHGGDLVALLSAEGRDIDQLIITHLHLDHAGGLKQVLDSGIPVGEILLPVGARQAIISDDSLQLVEEAEARGIPVREVGRGDIILSGRAKGQVLWPYRGGFYPGMDPNRGSLVVYWDLNGTGLLQAADLHADYAPYALRPAQILKVPHHGSKVDNREDLLALVAPELALFTAADFRPERFQAVEERLVNLDAESLVTGETGAITLRFSDGRFITDSFLPGRE